MQKRKSDLSQNYCQTQSYCHLLCRQRDDIISTNESLAQKWEVDFLANDLSGLNDIYREIADEIGIENAVAIYKLFHGTQVSFPSRLFSKEHIHKAIVKEYNGKNALQLAQKYNYSERSIWRILKSGK